jgi:hypothetical protein
MFFIKPARKPQAFKPGDEWRPERSGGNPAKPGSPKETLAFRPGSFIWRGGTRQIKSAIPEGLSL